MSKNIDSIVMKRIEAIAKKVYRGNKNALYMLINDLEEFFEINKNNNHVNMMTSDEFEEYIENIIKE